MLADDVSVSTIALEEGDDIEAELSFLNDLLAKADGAIAGDDVAWLRAESDIDERPRYRVMGPTLARVAAVSLTTLPAVLTPLPSFANQVLPPNLMIAMASRPVAPPPGLANAGAQLFPFSRPMRDLRAQVAIKPSEPAPIAALGLNPRLKTIFTEQRKVAVTSRRGPAATFYLVARGDSLYSISADLLGSGARWREIYAANQAKVGSTYLLVPGQKLVIPLQRRQAEPPSFAGRPGYQVSLGDSLYTIAQKRLGNPNRWKEIVMLNKAALNGRTLIFPNQWLALPGLT